MANRHDVQKKAKGGHAMPPLGGGNKDVAKEAFNKKTKKATGGAVKADQKATGGPAKPRLDKRARGGGTKSPFSAAHFSTSGDAGKKH